MAKRMSREKVHGSGCKGVSADGGWIRKPGCPSESLGRPQNDEIQICDQGPGICISLKTHPRQSGLTAPHGPMNVSGGPLLRLLLWFQWPLPFGWVSPPGRLLSLNLFCESPVSSEAESVLYSWDKF